MTNPDTAKANSTETHRLPIGTPTPAGMRKYLGLLGFLNKAELEAVFTQIPVSTTSVTIEAVDLWRASQLHASQLAPVSFSGTLLPVPQEAIPIVEEVKRTESFKRGYEAIADYDFAVVPFDELLSPQWEADLDYIEEVSRQAPQPDDWSGAFAFAMQEGAVGEPVINQNQVIFSSHRRDLSCKPIPEVRAIEPGVYEIVVRAQSRPNYIQVARLAGRLILVNGVHRALAMKKAGFANIPCVARDVGNHAELGLNPSYLFLRQEYTLGTRPALVSDFLTDGLAVPLFMRAMDQALRVSIGVEPLTIPALT